MSSSVMAFLMASRLAVTTDDNKGEVAGDGV